MVCGLLVFLLLPVTLLGQASPSRASDGTRHGESRIPRLCWRKCFVPTKLWGMLLVDVTRIALCRLCLSLTEAQVPCTSPRGGCMQGASNGPDHSSFFVFCGSRFGSGWTKARHSGVCASQLPECTCI